MKQTLTICRVGVWVAFLLGAGEAILRYTNGMTQEAFAANDEKRAAVERQVPEFVTELRPLLDRNG